MVLCLVLGGCIELLPPGGLPAVPYATLPGEPAELRKLADDVFRKSRSAPDLVRARTALKKAEKIERDEFANLWRLSRMDSLLARVDEPRALAWATEGRKAGDAARQVRPGRPEGHLFFGINTVMVARERAKDATELLNEAMTAGTVSNEKSSTYAKGEARRLLGAIYIFAPAWPTGAGDLDEGVATFEGLVKEFPDEPINVFYLAVAYRKAERKDDAIRLFRRVLRYPKKGLWRLEGAPFRTQAAQALSELRRGP